MSTIITLSLFQNELLAIVDNPTHDSSWNPTLTDLIKIRPKVDKN
jgi:hypothetical protein